jgi:Probable zinc-ribbon domain
VDDALARGVAVDPAALAPYGSYSPPEFVERGYYVDKPFVCEACGQPQLWTAARQKWWYEVAKGDALSTAKHCRACQKRVTEEKEQGRDRGGDPNPYKNPGLLLAKVRSEIEPQLLSRGYRLAGRNSRSAPRRLFIDYSQAEDLLTFSWDQHHARLTADFLSPGEPKVRTIATADFSGATSTAEIDARLGVFLASVVRFLAGPSAAEPEPIRQ